MKKKDDTLNKQESRRKELVVPILITRVKEDARGKTFFGYARNISRGGMFIQSINPRDEKERFRIEFSLPGRGETICGDVEVVWKRRLRSREPYEPGMGIRFVQIDEEKARAIDEWVESSLDKEPPGLRGSLNYV